MERLEFEKVYVDIDGALAIVTLNDPKALNAIGLPMVGGLVEALGEITNPDRGVRCLILTGEGRGFCSGANLGDGAPERVGEQIAALQTHYHPILRCLRNLPFPFITAVNGPAVGIGMSIALAGDMVLAARSAFFSQAFQRIGLVPDGGSTWHLPRLVGWARARELSMRGGRMSSDQALKWGAVAHVFENDSFRDEVLAIGHELANGPTVALGYIRNMYWQSQHNSFEEQLDLEATMQARAAKTEDHLEGLRSFTAKRDPEFKGR